MYVTEIIENPCKEAYLEKYGYHFNKKLCEWAVSQMERKVLGSNNIERIEIINKEQVDALLKKHTVELESDNGYDSTYIANMCKADFLNSSVIDERHMALFIKDMIDDIDQHEGYIFLRFCSDCVIKGVSIPWENVL